MENNFQNNIDKLFSEESKKAEENSHFPAFEKVWEKVESRLDEKQKDTKTFKMWLPYSIAASLAVIFGSLYFLNKTEISSEKPKIVIENSTKNNVEIPSVNSTQSIAENNTIEINKLDKEIQQNIKKQTVSVFNSVAYNMPKPKIVKELETKSFDLAQENVSAEMMVAAPSVEGFEYQKNKTETSNKLAEIETIKSVAKTKTAEKAAPKSAMSLEQNQVLAADSSNNYDDEDAFEDIKISTNVNEPPLYIVDGYVANVGFIKNYNMKKITSLNIVEGKSAVKLYGNYGKKGVVVITTRGLSKKEENQLKENSQKYNLPN